MKKRLSKTYNFKSKHPLRYVSNKNIELPRSFSMLFYIPVCNKLSNTKAFDIIRTRRMNLKYIVNNLNSKDDLANYILLDMPTDEDKLSSYNKDE